MAVNLVLPWLPTRNGTVLLPSHKPRQSENVPEFLKAVAFKLGNLGGGGGNGEESEQRRVNFYCLVI